MIEGLTVSGMYISPFQISYKFTLKNRFINGHYHLEAEDYRGDYYLVSIIALVLNPYEPHNTSACLSASSHPIRSISWLIHA